jgi:hypothetical protein
MFRSDQTRYHQEWVGFTKEIVMNANTGAITTFDASDSAGFQQRFQDWRGFRVIGWTCSIIPTRGYDQASGLTAHAAFNQSLLGATSFTAPLNLQSLLELPNAKTLPISDSNPRSKVNFQWFNRKGDINALPFQTLAVLPSVEYASGLVSFNQTPSNVIYTVCGKLLVQFKDKNFLNVNQLSSPDSDYQLIHDPVSPVVKRLNRTNLISN